MFLVADNLIALGNELSAYLNSSLPEDLQNKYDEKLQQAEYKNPWIINRFVKNAFSAWHSALAKNEVEAWFAAIKPNSQIKNIAVIGAGNLPLVALHDCFAVLSSGHDLWLKCSGDDEILLPFILERLCAHCNGLDAHIQFKTKGLHKADALIATGSNNSSRYFEYYFKHMPCIIRKNRTSVAVLDANTSNEEIEYLAQDMFMYFGRGCRSVGKFFVSEDFEIQRIFENSTAFNFLKDHNKYANNFDYHRAIYLMNRDAFLENDFFVLKESDLIHAPVAVYFYERFKNHDELSKRILDLQQDLQVVCGANQKVGFGENQCPGLNDYADNVDTIKFLESI